MTNLSAQKACMNREQYLAIAEFLRIAREHVAPGIICFDEAWQAAGRTLRDVYSQARAGGGDK